LFLSIPTTKKYTVFYSFVMSLTTSKNNFFFLKKSMPKRKQLEIKQRHELNEASP